MTRTRLLLAPLLLAAVAAHAEDRTVPLAVGEKGFAPAEIQATSGERFRLEVANQTAAAIEFESFELNRERVIQPGQTATIYLSGLSPGRYEFFDDFHQDRRGALVVK